MKTHLTTKLQTGGAASRERRAFRKAVRAFTLIELLTVIAIIGILAAILIPTVGAVRESANRAKCASNVRQIVNACHVFAEDNGSFPPAEGIVETTTVTGGRTRTESEQKNWLMHLSEGGYVDQERLQGGSDADTLFMCPTATRFRNLPRTNAATYGINAQASGGDLGGGTPNIRNLEHARDPSHVAMVMDGHWDGSQYVTRVNTATGNLLAPDYVHPPRGDSSSGVNIGFVDGHVSFKTKAEIDEYQADDLFWSGTIYE